ncbi:MAG: cupin domain-containing protein [Halobacteriales archaeon]
MSATSYAVHAIEGSAWSTGPGGAEHATLTDRLGATETEVDAYRLDSDGRLSLDEAPEQLVIVIEGTIALATDGESVIRSSNLLSVSAGRCVSVQAGPSSILLVVSADTEPAPEQPPTVLDPESAAFEIPATSEIATAYLTSPLGLTGMKANVRRLDPDQAVPAHTEGTQEELFAPISGPAALLIDGDRYPLATGDIARVGPDVPRSAINDGDQAALWVMIGAPPTGGPTDWDPGAEILD